MTVYLISSGDYSDYRLDTVLTAEAGKDLHALYVHFKQETGRPIEPPRPKSLVDHEAFHAREEWREAVREWYQRLEEQWGYRELYCTEGILFAHWLTTTQGFVEADYDELNLEDI